MRAAAVTTRAARMRNNMGASKSSVPVMLPNRLAPVGRWLPRYPGSLLLATALNQLVAQHLSSDLRARLDGKRVRVQVTDAELRFAFRVRYGRFEAQRDTPDADLRFAARAADFVAIAAGTADPDTLFFQRRLTIEGDTELATEVKNALDAIEFPRIRRALQAVLDVLPTA
jgi:predicted lipid carrier protein YhbT